GEGRRVVAGVLRVRRPYGARYHQTQIRRHLGFRECSVADADKLTEWLAANVCEAERRHDQVRAELLARCRTERIEPPTSGRMDRITRSALRTAERTLTARLAGRLPAEVAERLRVLVGPDVDDADLVGEDVSSLIKSVPGNVSLETMLTEIRKLRAVGPPAGLFADVAPKVLAAWRARAAVEAPSHLHDHPEPLMLTLLAALLHTRETWRQKACSRRSSSSPAAAVPSGPMPASRARRPAKPSRGAITSTSTSRSTLESSPTIRRTSTAW
ncbi:MAG TPA: DUF4158 domain-containing protein, partial [Thermopolyspora sp.]